MENVLTAVAWKTFEDAPCTCGNEALALRAKTSERAVRRSLERAEALGILKRKRGCRGFAGGRGRLHDTIYIVGFNDIAMSDQKEGASERSSFGLNGHTDTTNRTPQPDQPDSTSAPYKKLEVSTTDKLNPSLPSPDVRMQPASPIDEDKLKRDNATAFPSARLRALLASQNSEGLQ